jgi:hypothetical protein
LVSNHYYGWLIKNSPFLLLASLGWEALYNNNNNNNNNHHHRCVYNLNLNFTLFRASPPVVKNRPIHHILAPPLVVKNEPIHHILAPSVVRKWANTSHFGSTNIQEWANTSHSGSIRSKKWVHMSHSGSVGIHKHVGASHSGMIFLHHDDMKLNHLCQEWGRMP